MYDYDIKFKKLTRLLVRWLIKLKNWFDIFVRQVETCKSTRVKQE